MLSEGTLRVLGLLALGGAKDPPALIGFEEPENGIHPRRIKLIAEYLKTRAAEGETQIIVTTHSPILPDLIPDRSLYVCRRQGGQTAIEPLSHWGPLSRRSEIETGSTKSRLHSRSPNVCLGETSMRKVLLFAEDVGHEEFITAWVERFANECKTPISIRPYSVRGGQGRAIRELTEFARDVHEGKEAWPDLLIIAIDANCHKFAGAGPRSRRLPRISPFKWFWRFPTLTLSAGYCWTHPLSEPFWAKVVRRRTGNATVIDTRSSSLAQFPPRV